MAASILPNIAESAFPGDFTEAEKSEAKTLFFKRLALYAHEFYGGKLQTASACFIGGADWFNTWYTPGVSAVSTAIRDDNDASFSLTSRGNTVAVVSDSTRVLGDGDCTPPGGLGVMEGKALLMKYLGGVDAVPLCVNSRGEDGSPDPRKIVDFVTMAEPSFGAINLEDISQPNCFYVLDELQKRCSIPVWHDDAQGTACVTLAGLLNALELAGKKLEDVRIAFLGAGASNTTIARLILAAGGDPANIVMCDSRGGLHKNRADVQADERYYRKWELCRLTNPSCIDASADAVRGADVLIALSKPGPGAVKSEWIASMADKAIVFCCANPVPEIWPSEAKKAGAFIVATGRGDFPNQINNSVCFPGLLKGVLLARAKKITDTMTLACARSIALFARRRGITSDNIIATMEESDVFAVEAAEVARAAAEEGVARIELSREEAYERAKADISKSRAATDALMKGGIIPELPSELCARAQSFAISEITARRLKK